MESFDMITYCNAYNIPCFTFPMDHTKRVSIKWGSITPHNFSQYIHKHHNGFAIVTGYTHVVIDFDEKYHPPLSIKQILTENCSAIEETPGGFHFWFTVDQRTTGMESGANIDWDGNNITGLDIRAKKGICYVAPSHYTLGNEIKQYKWVKGNLSTASIVPDTILTHLLPVSDISFDNAPTEIFRDQDKITIKITPRTKLCLVKPEHIHSSVGHSCIYLTKLKTCYSATANCFSHGKRKMSKEVCDALVEQYWIDEDTAINDEYSTMKELFENNNFKTLNPVGFYSYINHSWMFRERAQMKITYENHLLSDGTPFLDKWLKDPHMKTYKHISIDASNDPSVFVLPDLPPPSFLYTSYECVPNVIALPVFEQFLDVLTNHKRAIKEYILNWCAHLVQKPLELPGVALIFIGQKGVGKDTFGDFLGTYIIGSTYYQNYSNQLQYFDKHDIFKANKFLVKVEELSRKILCDENNDTYIKSSITAPTTTINPKNGTPYEVRNYKRVIGTTNHSNALNIDQNERRYVFSVVSPEKMGDHTYWTMIRDVLFTPAGALAVTNMLLAQDITSFNPRALPENTYLKQLQEDTTDSVQKFIEQCEAGEYSGNELYHRYRDYCSEEGIYSYTNTKFSMQLLFLKENGSIVRSVERHRTKQAVKYIIK